MQKFVTKAIPLTFEDSVRTYQLTELARGDFNGDGFDDSLIEVSWHHREGTGVGNEILLVQRVEGKPLTVQPFLLR